MAATRVFFDDFNSYAVGDLPTTGQWSTDGTHDICTVVAVSQDGVLGPRTGNRMLQSDAVTGLTLATHNSFQTAVINSFAYTVETFYRVWTRIDANHSTYVDPVNNSARKFLRIYHPGAGTHTPSSNDHFQNAYYAGGGLVDGGGQAGGVDDVPTYWGGAPGDNTRVPTSWHKIEYYFNHATSAMRVWHDGLLVRDEIGQRTVTSPWYPFYMCSNWSDGEMGGSNYALHNYIYFDSIEVYTDATSGTPAVGLMSDASVTAGSQLVGPITTRFVQR